MSLQTNPYYLGLDIGSSGIRGICIDQQGDTLASAKFAFEDTQQAREPYVWKAGVAAVMADISRAIPLDRIAGLAVDGQSGTVLLCDDRGMPLSAPMFYNELAEEPERELVASSLRVGVSEVPPTLGRVAALWAENKPARFHVTHQADWIGGLFTGRFDISDENNALKLGYDPGTRDWAFDASLLPFDHTVMPTVLPPATKTGPACGAMAAELGLSVECRVYTGTTDGMAGFIAASGLDDLAPGTAVTSLGTTLVIKIVSSVRVDMAAYGIYSHKLFDNWIAGGASNSGGGALLQHFTSAEIAKLSKRIDPDQPTGLDYYPLICKGERFPVCDPALENRTSPRPDDDARFLAGLFESIARIEKTGFDLLFAQGVPSGSPSGTPGCHRVR